MPWSDRIETGDPGHWRRKGMHLPGESGVRNSQVETPRADHADYL